MTVPTAQIQSELAAAGWSTTRSADEMRASMQIAMCVESYTVEGFRATLKDANEIRALVELAAPSIESAGYDADGLAFKAVAAGYSVARFRGEMLSRMAEADVHTSNVRKVSAQATTDASAVYEARAKQLTELAAK